MIKLLATLLLPALLVVACDDKTTHNSNPASAESGAGAANAGGDATDAGGMSSSAGKASSGASAVDPGGAGNDPGAATDLDTFLAEEGRGFCARLFRCFESGGDDFMAERFALETPQRCEDLLARVNATSRDIRDLRAQIAAGNIHYVPEQGQECLSALAECNGTDSFGGGACREAFDGKAKTGEACQRAADCAGDAYCDLEGACPGTCQARKAEGETCVLSSECAYTEGAVFCDHDSGPMPVCHTLAASPKVGLGKPCTRNLTGAASLLLCSDDLWCATLPGGDANQDPLGQCAKPIAGSGACADGDDVCTDGLCDETAGTCQAYTLRKQAGETCDKASRTFCDPLASLVCGPDGTCLFSGDGSEGKGCFTSDLQWGCDPGLYCKKPLLASSDEPGTCEQLLPDGAACDRETNCESGGCVNMSCTKRGCYQ
jgi:hypothetical protein